MSKNAYRTSQQREIWSLVCKLKQQCCNVGCLICSNLQIVTPHQAAAHILSDVQSLYRDQWKQWILNWWSGLIKPDSTSCSSLNMLLWKDKMVDECPDLNWRLLQMHLAKFGLITHIKWAQMLLELFEEMVPEAKGLFSQVEALVRLLLVLPASSAERSFYALRRHLRHGSSMSQTSWMMWPWFTCTRRNWPDWTLKEYAMVSMVKAFGFTWRMASQNTCNCLGRRWEESRRKERRRDDWRASIKKRKALIWKKQH